MPTYEISAPDGNKYQIEGPEGATQDQIIKEVVRQNPFAGQTTEELKKAPSAPSTFRDINETAAMSLAGGLKSLTDLFGANNAVSRNLAEKQETALKQMTPARLKELQVEEELANRAEGKPLEEASTAGRAFLRSPLQGLTSGVFSTIPQAVAYALAPEVALPAGIARLVGTGVAGKVAQKVAGASPGIAVGSAMGVGSQKGQDYQAVKEAMLKRGATEEEAEVAAQKAAEYSRENAPRQIASGIAGGAEAALGVESVLGRMGRAGKVPATAPTRIGSAATSALGEAIPEAIQSVTGTVGTNIALQQAGFDRDLMAGVAGQATTDALTGALLGTAVSPLQYRSLQNDFLRQQNEEANKKQEEFQKKREEFVKKYQEQQEETKKNLGLNMLALPAPATTAEEKYRNPAATITRQELGEQEVNGKKIKSEVLQYLDDYRKANNLPALKAYSIEDIKDAMPGLNPEGEKAILDSILAGKYGYKPVDETTGNEIKYTSDDIMALAEEEKNIATGTQGFKDFLTSVTGTDNVGEMSQPQLHAAYSALQNFEPAEETRILPEGTAATRFSQKQYDNALKVVNIEFASIDNKPLDPKVIAKEIKEATGLENDRDALALLDTAVKNGDLTFSTKPVFRVVDPATGKFVHTATTRAKAEAFAKGKDLNIYGDSQSYISPAEQDTLPDRTPLPAGYQINQERVVEGEEDLVDVMREGRGQALETIAVDKAQERIDTLTGESKALADRALKRIEQDSATTQKIQKNLDQRIAKGEGKTRDFEIQKTRSERAITNLRKRIQKNLDKIEELSAPIKTRKSEVKKPIIKKKLTVTKGGKAIGTFSNKEIGKANAQAQDAILTQMTDEEIQAAIDNKKLGLFSKNAKKEQDRRRGPTGFKIKKAKTPETLSPEFVDKAEEIKKRLVPMLQRFGLGNVGLNIVNAIKNNAEGSYLNSLIQVAFPDPSDPNAANPVQTMRHEALHALRDLGFFTDSQWQALTNKAKSEWIQKYLKNQNVEVDGKVMSRYDGYVYINQTEPAAWNKANPDKPPRAVMSDAALNELLVEEAIADAFGDFDANGSPAGMMAAILKRLNQFFEALRNAITGAGFQTAEDIFGKVERGELKGEKDGRIRSTEPTARPSTGRNEAEKLSIGRAGERRGRLPDGGIAPLEGAPTIEGATGPDPRIVEVAENYAKSAGIPFKTQANYSYVYPQKASRIAKAYEDMEHAPNDPKVKQAYQELIDQTRAQYDALTKAGYKFTFFDGNTDPYKGNPFNAMRDLRKNKKMAVYGTYDGFGTEGITAGAVDDNPLLQDTGLRWKDQKGKEHPVTGNDLFRAVHDAFGHGLEGAGFRARGEENAWQAHAKMYTGLARGAMTSETRGQNSWLNFGPYGEKNRNAKLEDTVFAEQKTGLMPEWVWNEAMVSDEKGVTLGKLQPDAQTYDAVHYGKQASLNKLLGDKYGEGLRGGERRRLDMSDDPRIQKRAYFYIENDKGEMPVPESGLGANVYTQRFNNILGPGPAMNAISAASRGDSNTFESNVIDAGYDGYAVPSMGMMVVLNHNAPVNYQGTRPELQEKMSLKIVRDNEAVSLEGKPSVNSIGKYFDKSIMDAFGRKLSYQNAEDFDRAFNQALEEVTYQIEQEKSGLDWYDKDIKNSFKETATVIPELKKIDNRILFSVMAGIMSPQTTARDNWFIAAKNFQNYLSTGTISGVNPESGGLWQGGTQSANKKVQLEFLDAMVKDMGKKKALAWIMSDHPVSEINSFRLKYGKMKSGIDGKMADMRPGLYAFGPKVGPFVANLNGIHDVTVDKWMTRTFNRYFGTMIGPDENIIDAPTEPQRRAIKKLVTEVAQNANIKPYQVQSLLWFYEQKLFTKLGVPSPSYAFSDGARRFTKDARDRGGEAGVAGAVEPTGKLSLRKAPETPAFKRWFGDSKIVNDDGTPRVMYHGSRKDFSEPTTRSNRNAFFVTPDENFASKYALNDLSWFPEKTGTITKGEEGAQIYPVYISAKNPFDYENSQHLKKIIPQFRKVLKEEEGYGQDLIQKMLNRFQEGQWRAIELANDYDLFEKNGFDAFYTSEQGRKNLGVFEPNQVKSAIGNQGTYTESPDIRLSLRSTRQPPESKEFKQWFGESFFVDDEGNPVIVYHGTARDITIFKGKQAKAIFVTTKPYVAEDYANMGVDYMRAEAYKALTRDEKVELITVVAEQGERDGTITKAELKEIQSNLKKRVPTINEKTKSIVGLPYQIETEIIASLNNLLPTKGNIMPVYVNARNVFDYANKDHVNKVYNWMMNNSRALGSMQNPEQWLKKVKDLVSRGNWVRIESEDVQEAIRALDFDGFSVLEAGSKNYAVYNPTNIKSVTGNIGTFGLGEVTSEQAKQFGMTADQAKQAQEEGDIRFSLRKAPDTPEFKRWFGKSKVVDENGDPLIVFHTGAFDANEIISAAEQYRRTYGKSSGYMQGGNEGIYFSADPLYSSLYGKREGKTMYPVYLSIKNPFVVENKEQMSRLVKLKNFILGKREVFRNSIISDTTDPSTDSMYITPEYKAELIKRGYDGIVNKEHNEIVAFEPTQIKSAIGNRGTYDFTNPDIRYSLKSTLPANIAASIEKTTTVREEKGFAERMMDAISPKGFSSWRAEAVNRYNALSIAAKMRIDKTGGVGLYADQNAEAMALLSDDAAGVAAAAMGVHDRHGGIPVFRNGITTIDDSVEGILPIFAPLAKYKDPFVYQMYQFYSGAKRERRYLDKGIEKNYDANDIAYAEQLGKQYPEFEEIFKKWDKYNKGLVKYQVDTGVLSPAEGANYIKYSDYTPFYRQLEGENTFGPNVFQSISGVKKPKKYKGGEAPIADFMETIVRNTQSAIQAGMKNTAAKVAVDTFKDIGQAEAAPDDSTGEEFVHVLEGGVKKSYLVYDKALVQAVMSLNLPDLPFIGFFAGPANLLRNLVTKDPGFMLANMVRDSMSAWVTSGVNMTPVASAAKNFVGALRGTSPEYKALLNAGILGGYEYSQGVEVSAANMKKALGRYEPATGLNKLKYAPRSLWEALEKGTMASDAATRMEVYKNVLAETGNEAEALYRAQEVMNFQRKGRSAVVRVLTAGIPFLNARIQGLDVLYRAMSGQMGTVDAAKIQKAFFVRGASIMAISMLYWFLTHDDDEYKKQEQETRDNNWLIPSLGIKIPIPFEVGVIFKVIPERIAEYFFGNDTGKDFADSMKRNFQSTFMFNLIPQVGLPLYEAATNHSFFTGRDIVGAGLEGVKAEYQVGPGTSQLAAWLGSQTGYSPMLIDHVIGGYTGTFGSYAVDVVDSIAFANSDVQRPSKRFEQLPVFKRFLLDPQAKGNVTAYYDLKNSVDEAVRTSNFLEKTSNFEEMGKYSEETLRVLASKDFISDMEKDMKELRETALFVRTSTMSPDDKRDTLRSITDAENAMTSNIRYLRKLMD